MRATVTTLAKGQLNPFIQNPALGGTGFNGVKNALRRFRDLIANLITGQGIFTRAESRPTLWYSTANAVGTVTFAAAQVGDTVTVNGQALTATQQRASGTVTCATALAASTVTVNGHLFTAVAGAPAANQFSIDTSDTATATSLALAIQTAAAIKTNALLFGLIGAKSAVGVVTVFAQQAGTGGNALTLASSDGTTLAVSAATLANGAAAGANQFDYIGTDAVNAGSLADALAASTTALVSGQVVGSNRAAVVTCASTAAGDTVTLAGVVLTAINTATDSAGARITTFPPSQWAMNSTDTNDAVSLVNCINSHPRLKELFFASSAVGAVTIRERNPSIGGEAVVTTSNGTRLAVTVAINGLFQPSAVCLLQAIHSGATGNMVTLASSNSGRLLTSGTRLTLGLTTSVAC